MCGRMSNKDFWVERQTFNQISLIHKIEARHSFWAKVFHWIGGLFDGPKKTKS
jgi:hypothetical protein